MSYNPPLHKKIFHKIRRELAKFWLIDKKALQIGITGSQGKTNTTHILYQVLKSVGETCATDTNMDTIYNVPVTALRVRSNTKFIVWELGIDSTYEMDRHLEIAKPSIGIVTGVSAVHADEQHLGSFENVIKEKRKLVESLPADGFAILNWDDENVRKMAEFTKARVLYFGSDEKYCNIITAKSELTLGGSKYFMKSKELGSIECSTGLIGDHHKFNMMACLLVFEILKIPLTKTLEIISKLKPLEGRMSIEKRMRDTIWINDSLRANPVSTKAGLRTLSQIQHTKGRKIAVLNEMGELENPENEHVQIGEYLSELNIDLLVCIGPLQRFTADTALKKGMKNVYYVENVVEAAKLLKKILKCGDLVYLKGSLLRHSERILLYLDNQNVGCDISLCPFYRHCRDCEFLEDSYKL